MNPADFTLPLLITAIICAPAIAAEPSMVAAPPPVSQVPPPPGQSAPSAAQAPIVAAPAPIMGSGPQMDKQKKPPPRPTFQFIVFDIVTGGDDLRSDSTAQANLQYQDGTSQTCALKNLDDDTWGNNSGHADISCQLNKPRTFADLKLAHIQIQMFDCLFHTGCHEFEQPDNWNIRSVQIVLRNTTDLNNTCLYNISGTDGNDFARLTQTTKSVELDGHATTC
jgi:hypothetical protein